MLDSIINAFLEFKWFMLLNVGLTIAAGVILWLPQNSLDIRERTDISLPFSWA